MDYLYYPVLALGLILLVTTCTRSHPSTNTRGAADFRARCWPRRSSSWPATGCASTCGYVYSHGLTYGALATPITFLLFYYFVAMAIIIGAQFNNALLEYYPPVARRKDFKAARKDESVALAPAA